MLPRVLRKWKIQLIGPSAGLATAGMAADKRHFGTAAAAAPQGRGKGVNQRLEVVAAPTYEGSFACHPRCEGKCLYGPFKARCHSGLGRHW